MLTSNSRFLAEQSAADEEQKESWMSKIFHFCKQAQSAIVTLPAVGKKSTLPSPKCRFLNHHTIKHDCQNGKHKKD